MNKDKLNELLSKRVKSPVPHLHADPFLPTRIEVLAKENDLQISVAGGLLANWSMASILAAGAMIIGIYIGSGLTNNTAASESSAEIFTEYTDAFYQSGFVDDWHDIFEDGDTQ